MPDPQSFHDVLFPPEIALGSRGGPARRTDVVVLASGHEKRSARWAHSRRRWDASSGIKCAADLAEIVAFFEAREGRRYAFRWRDPLDHSSAVNGAQPAPTDQRIGTGDGAQMAFQLSKSYGGASARPVTKPVPGSVVVAVDAAPVAASVDDAAGVVTLAEPPPEGAAVTAGFLFDVPARFDTDELIATMLPQGGTVDSLPVVEVRI